MTWPIYLGRKLLGSVEAETAAEAFKAATKRWPDYTPSEFTTFKPVSRAEQQRQDRIDEEEAIKALTPR